MGKDDHVASEPVNFRESVQSVRFLKLRCEAQYRFLGSKCCWLGRGENSNVLKLRLSDFACTTTSFRIVQDLEEWDCDMLL